jgi:hypothetical protein
MTACLSVNSGHAFGHGLGESATIWWLEGLIPIRWLGGR